MLYNYGSSLFTDNERKCTVGAKKTVEERPVLTSEELVRKYLPSGHKFKATASDPKGNGNKDILTLPAFVLRGASPSKGREGLVCEIPEGASMTIYTPYVSVRTGATIAAIFFPNRDVQIKIMAGGFLIIRRF